MCVVGQDRRQTGASGGNANERWNRIAGLLILGALAVYIGILLVHAYRLDSRRQHQALVGFVRQTDMAARTVEALFGLCRQTAEGILGKRDLWALLDATDDTPRGAMLAKVLETEIATHRVAGRNLFLRLVLLDGDGRVLADTETPDIAEHGAMPDWTRFIAVDMRRAAPRVALDPSGQRLILFGVGPLHGERMSAYLVAWTCPSAVPKFLGITSDVGTGFALLTAADQILYAPDVARQVDMGQFGDHRLDLRPTQQPLHVTFRDGSMRTLVAASAPVDGTPFNLVLAMPETDGVGSQRSWEFALPMAILGGILLVGATMALRARFQGMVLQARLQEAYSQRQWLEDKNRQLEREISERRLLSTAVEQSAESIIITATDGTIQYVNPAFERITGYVRTEVLGENPRILRSGKQDKRFYRTMWQTIQDGGVWSGHVTDRRKDGTNYEAESVISPVRDTKGNIANYVAVTRDVTVQMAMEAQLRQSQKMEAIGELAGGVAHDFNNLLTVIIGNCNLLLCEPQKLTSGLCENVEEIAKASNRAAALTRQLLAFSRRQLQQREIIELNTVVTNTERLLRRLVREDIHFAIDVPAEPSYIKADPVQIDQIIINLTVNARDAMPAGGKLSLAVRQIAVDRDHDEPASLKPGLYALLEVTDTGCGMDEHIQAQIFEPFFTTKGAGVGTGLGLATVSSIVKQHNGAIQVRSKLGEGTTFSIFLPRLSERDAAEDQREQLQRASEQPEPLKTGSETILLVDDEESVLSMIKRVLESNGYTIHAAINDKEVLDIWEKHQNDIHLLITDIIMPGMSGIEIATSLRGDQPALRVICMSAYADSTIMKMNGGQFEHAFLQKPFSPDELLRKVREVMTPRA